MFKIFMPDFISVGFLFWQNIEFLVKKKKKSLDFNGVCIKMSSALSFVRINNELKSTAASLGGSFGNLLSRWGSDFRACFIFNGLIY